MKTCPKCGETKDADGFGRNRNRRDGMQFYCKRCRVRNPDARPRQPITEKRCPACGEVKPAAEFGYQKGRGGRPKLRSRCRPCHARLGSLRAAERRRTDPEFLERTRAIQRRSRTTDAALTRQAELDAQRSTPGTKPWARRKLQSAVQRNRIVKPLACERCGNETPLHQLHGHHWHGDYASRPLDVMWLCSLCHGAEHAEHTQENAGMTSKPTTGQQHTASARALSADPMNAPALTKGGRDVRAAGATS